MIATRVPHRTTWMPTIRATVFGIMLFMMPVALLFILTPINLRVASFALGLFVFVALWGVIDAGIYDGCYGVLAGLAVIEAMQAAGLRPARPLAVVAFTNEEGVRYQPDMMGSLVAAGGLRVDDDGWLPAGSPARLAAPGRPVDAQQGPRGHVPAGPARCPRPARPVRRLPVIPLIPIPSRALIPSLP